MEKNSGQKHFLKKRIRGILILLLILFVSLSAGCGKISSEDRKEVSNVGKPRKFGATYMTMNNPYFEDLNAKIEESVEANGDILIYRDPAQNQEKQNEQIQDMLDEGVTLIFLNPVDWQTVKPALIACKRAGVPVINIDTRVYDDEYVAFSILSDNYNAGVQCAKDMMSKKSEADIVILDSPGTNSIMERVQGFLDTVEKNPNYRIAVKDHGMGELEVSMDVMNKILLSGKKFDVVLGGNDPTALGALASLQMNQKQDGILIYGIDGSPDGKVMIKEGYMEGSSAQQPMVIAAKAVEMAYDYLDGKPVEKCVVVPVTMITKKNIEKFDLAGWQ